MQPGSVRGTGIAPTWPGRPRKAGSTHAYRPSATGSLAARRTKWNTPSAT